MLFLLFTVLALASAQTLSDIDKALIDIFGTPSTTPTYSTKPFNIDDVTVKPTQSGTVYINPEGEECICVPYYLCDSNLVLKNETDPGLDGYGKLDIRFGEPGNRRQCQESVENCCTRPKQPEPEPDPVPDNPNAPLPDCGYRNPKGIDFTLIGGNGNEALFGEFPWVIAILKANDLSYLGVGVLIHPQVVMTAAHIVSMYEPGSVLARAGEWDTQTNKERLKSQEIIVNTIVIEKDFLLKSLKNDVALLRLAEPFRMAPHISTLCLPSLDEEFDDYKQCVANGWGKANFGKKNKYVAILKKVEVDMVPFNKCSAQLKKTRLGPRFVLHNSFVCAGGEEGKDTCSGDGGAPLACPIGNNRYKLAGLVAWGIGCGQKDVPAVYVRVSAFRNWVDDVMFSWGFPTSAYTLHNNK